MKTRFIHDNFQLDVSNLELVWTEENTWFKDEFFLSSSFPFELDYGYIPYFERFRHKNLSLQSFYFEGKLEKNGKIEDAVLELESAGDNLQLTIRYGVEALPNWNKNISEIPLAVVLPLGGDMAFLANQMLGMTYPDVNYNFPAIHSKFYQDSPMYEHFQGTLNKRVGGFFVLNTETFEEVKNRNIVYPFPYHLYVLKSVIEEAGYVLKGDILTDPDLKDAILFSGKKIFDFEALPKPVEWNITEIDREYVDWPVSFYSSSMELNYKGNFRLTGVINSFALLMGIKLNGVVIYTYREGMPLDVDVTFDTPDNDNLLELELLQRFSGSGTVAALTLKTNHLYDIDGNQIPYLANFSNVQLADKLPDMTVGEFIKFHKNLKNYDFDLRNNNEIWMNLIKNEVTDSEVIDISEFESNSVIRKFEQAKSFSLQYEGEYDDYKFTKVFIDKNGFVIDDFENKEDTTSININGIPLPIEEQNGITTAVQLTDDGGKLMLVKYDGLNAGENWAKPMNLDCQTLFLNYWQQWLNFMVHATKFTWSIKAHPNSLMNVRRKSKLFSFNNLFFVFSLNRSLKKDVEEITIEAYSSKV